MAAAASMSYTGQVLWADEADPRAPATDRGCGAHSLGVMGSWAWLVDLRVLSFILCIRSPPASLLLMPRTSISVGFEILRR